MCLVNPQSPSARTSFLINPMKLIQPLILLACLTAGAAEPAKPVVQEGEMAGYLLVPHEKVPATFNAGFSLYAAAWPLLDKYPGHRFQTGLFGTWMFAQNDPKPAGKMYSDVEGGL